MQRLTMRERRSTPMRMVSGLKAEKFNRMVLLKEEEKQKKKELKH